MLRVLSKKDKKMENEIITDNTKQEILKLCKGTGTRKGIGWPQVVSNEDIVEKFDDLRLEGFPEGLAWYAHGQFVTLQSCAADGFEKWLGGKLVEAGCHIGRWGIGKNYVTCITFGDLPVDVPDINNNDHLEALLEAAKKVLK